LSSLGIYRSTPNSTTGVAPFSLMFEREMKTKLPSINSEVNAKLLQQAAADTNAVNKARAKNYADAKAKAIESKISVGDKVLLRQNKTCKLDANFGKKPCIVIGKEGSELVTYHCRTVRWLETLR